MDLLSILLILTLLAVNTLLLVKGNIKVQRLALIAIIVVFSYICAVRPETSADTSNYLFYYEKAQSLTSLKWGLGRDYNPWIENWYINYCWLLNRIGLSFRQYLFVTSFLFNILSLFSIVSIYNSLYKDNRKINGLVSVILLFFTQYGILYSYVAIRAGLAMAFCLTATALYYKKKYVFSVLFLLLAIAFQNYSIAFVIVLILLMIRKENRNNKLLMTVFILLLLLSFVRIDIRITSLLSRIPALRNIFQNTTYYEAADSTFGIKKGILLYLVQNIYLLYLLKDRYENKINNLFAIILVGSIIVASVSSNSTIRLANYFLVFQVFLYTEYLNGMTYDNGKERAVHLIIITILVPVLSTIYMLRYCGII